MGEEGKVSKPFELVQMALCLCFLVVRASQISKNILGRDIAIWIWFFIDMPLLKYG